MRTFLNILVLLLLSMGVGYTQNISVTGKVINKNNLPVKNAVISIMQSDSALIKKTTSDSTGFFLFTELQTGNYILLVSSLNYQDTYLAKTIDGSKKDLGIVILFEKTTELNVVDIVTNVTPVKQKGDTTEINAAAFKTNPDATAEDLVGKMPGISVQNGKVQAQGEDLQKVLVDGKEFFGNDASAVLKNLPAEVVDKIQIFDKKSDQSDFTGFDDGNTSKTINIVTKQQFRNGTFGKIFAGYGYDEKWKAGFTLNFFKDKRRVSILGNSNNINDQNFSSEDLLGVMSSSGTDGSGGRRGGSRGGQGGPTSDAGNFLVDQKSGITQTQAFGINYADQWKKVGITSSYFLNYTDNNSTNSLYRQYISNEPGGLNYNENKINNSTNLNHRLNLRLDWKIDSTNSLLIQPKFSLQQNQALSNLNGLNLNSSSILSNTRNKYNSDLKGLNISAPLLYRHSFKKRGRTISTNINPSYNTSNGASNLETYTNYYTDTLTAIDTLNQLAERDIKGLTLNSSLNYTEPLSQKSQLMLTYSNNLNKNNSDKETFDYSMSDGTYSKLDTTLSNKFASLYQANSVGTTYRFNDRKWNFSVGLSFQNATLKSDQVFPDMFGVNKTFNSLLPNGRFQYRFSTKKNLRITYRSSNNSPSVSQLQNVINNTNPLQLSTGNPDLKQDWSNNLVIRYSATNTEKVTAFYALMSATTTNNYIVSNTYIANSDTTIASGVILSKGSQLTKPININGYYTLRSFNNYSFPIAKLKSNLSLNIGATYTHTPGMVNNAINYSNSVNLGFGFVVSSNISPKVDFTLSSNTTFNNISNTLQTQLNSNYYNQNSKFKIQFMPWKGLVAQTELNHQYNTGLSSAYNQNYLLWNAAIGYKFLKDKLAELRLSVFDIMKQNNSISRNNTETYFEDVQSNVLQQYYMLTFTYNIKKFKESKPKPAPEEKRQ